MTNKQAQALSLMRPQRDVECKECGETFKARDSRAMFCSNKCKQRDKYRRFKSGAVKPTRTPERDSGGNN